MKKLVVIFPGVGYGFNHPLLYYADLLFEAKGYERKYMRYQDICVDAQLTIEEKKVKVSEYVFEQADLIAFKNYEEIVFLSKSLLKGRCLTLRMAVALLLELLMSRILYAESIVRYMNLKLCI